MSGRRRLLRLVTVAGLLRVRVCPLCAALVVAAGAMQHDRVHMIQTTDGEK